MSISLHHTPLIMAAATIGSTPLGATGLTRVITNLEITEDFDLLAGLPYETISATLTKASQVDPLKSMMAAKNLGPLLQGLADPKEQRTALVRLVQQIGDEHFPAEAALAISDHLRRMLRHLKEQLDRSQDGTISRDRIGVERNGSFQSDRLAELSGHVEQIGREIRELNRDILSEDIEEAKEKLDQISQTRPSDPSQIARSFGKAPALEPETHATTEALVPVESPQVPDTVSKRGWLERLQSPSESVRVLHIKLKSLYRIWSRSIDYIFARRGRWTRYSEFWRVFVKEIPHWIGTPTEELKGVAESGQLEARLAAIKILSWRAEQGEVQADECLANLEARTFVTLIEQASVNEEEILSHTLIITLHNLIERWGSWRAVLAFRAIKKRDEELSYVTDYYYHNHSPSPEKFLERIKAGTYPENSDLKKAFRFMIRPRWNAFGGYDTSMLKRIVNRRYFPPWARETALLTLLEKDPQAERERGIQRVMYELLIKGETTFQLRVASLLPENPDPELLALPEMIKVCLCMAILKTTTQERATHQYSYRETPSSEWLAIYEMRGYYNLALLRRTFASKSSRLSMYERGGIETVPAEEGEQQRRIIYSWVNEKTLLIEAIGRDRPEQEDLIGVRWTLVYDSSTSSESESFKIIDADMQPDAMTSQAILDGIRRELLEQLHNQLLHFDQRDEGSV